MDPIYASTIGGIGDRLMQLQQLQQQRDAEATQNFMRGLSTLAAHNQALRQERERAGQNAQDRELRNATLAAATADRADTLDYRNRGLKLSEDYQNWLMKQPTKANEKNILERLASAKNEIQAGTFDPSNYADLPPEHLNPLARIDAGQRQTDAEALAKATEVANAANFLKRYDLRMKQIKDSPGFMSTGNWSKPETSPEAAQRVEALRRNLAPLLTDPKLKVVETDPTTGNYVPPASLIKPWMTMGTNTPAGAVSGRQLNMSTAPASALPQAVAPSVAPRPLNIATPPTATGTNMPPLVRQNGIVFRLMPDGSYQPVAP